MALVIVLICISLLPVRLRTLLGLLANCMSTEKKLCISFANISFGLLVIFLLMVGVFDTYWSTKSESIKCGRYLLIVSLACPYNLFLVSSAVQFYLHFNMIIFLVCAFWWINTSLNDRNILYFLNKSLSVLLFTLGSSSFFFPCWQLVDPGSGYDHSLFSPLILLL